jgi:proteasome lid subunit RPN8/RPN11
MAIEQRRKDKERMEQHGAEAYPRECCGILLGKAQGARKIITEVVRVKNARADSAGTRSQFLREEIIVTGDQSESITRPGAGR